MDPFGVKVSLLEPGNFVAATSIFSQKFIKEQADSMWDNSMTEEVKSAYGEAYFNKRVEIMSSFMSGGITDSSPVTDAYINALIEVWPQKRRVPVSNLHLIDSKCLHS